MSYEIVDATFVMNNMDDLPLIDVRPKSMYDEGHIPGAKNVPFDVAKMKTVGADGPDEAPELAKEFREQFEAVGIDPNTEAIVYCLTGYHTERVCNMLSEDEDYTNLKAYKGSFNDWTSDTSRPVEK